MIKLDFSAFKVSLLTVNHVHTSESSSVKFRFNYFKISVCISYTSIIGKHVEMNLIGRLI